MPEGDTVWNTARVLHRALAGTRLTGSDFRVPQLATTDLAGWTVRESASRGKHLLLRLTAPTDDTAPPADAARPDEATRTGGGARWTLHSHLRMDGAWRAYAPGERWTARPAHLIRVVLHGDRAVAVGYHLHELTLVPTTEEESLVGHLGPDLLGADWDPAEAVRRLAAHPDATISEALLDQRNLAGVGNLYRCEVLFLRGVSPWTPVRAVPDLGGAVAWRSGCSRRTGAAGRRAPRGRCAGGRPATSTAGAPSRAAGAAPPSARRNWASGSPTGVRSANPNAKRTDPAGLAPPAARRRHVTTD